MDKELSQQPENIDTQLQNESGFQRFVDVVSTAWRKGYVKAGLALTILGLIEAGCAPVNAATISPPNLDSNNPNSTELISPPTSVPFTPELPTSEPTMEPTPTPEPTPSPADLARELGISDYSEHNIQGAWFNRKFEVQEIDGATYLIDQFNRVPKAVMQEDGSWRKLDYHDRADAELMYSAMAPMDRQYFFPKEMIRDSASTGFSHVIINPIYTGDWFTKNVVDFEGRDVTLYYAVVLMRDGDGGLRVVDLGFDAEGVEWHLTPYAVNGFIEWAESPRWGISRVAPGQALSFIHSVPFPFRKNIARVKPYDETAENSALDRLTSWFMLEPAEGQLTHEEGERARREYWWPDRVVVAQSFRGLVCDYEWERTGEY